MRLGRCATLTRADLGGIFRNDFCCYQDILNDPRRRAWIDRDNNFYKNFGYVHVTVAMVGSLFLNTICCLLKKDWNSARALKSDYFAHLLLLFLRQDLDPRRSNAPLLDVEYQNSTAYHPRQPHPD